MQERIFWDSEGDAWYQRNRHLLTVERALQDFPMQLLEQEAITPKRVLEIGCANGYLLEAIRRKYRAVCYGSEASEGACRAGRIVYPKLYLAHSTEVAPIRKIDLCIASFIFHWLDRKSIWGAADQMYHSILDGGYLLLADFLPSYPCKRAYKHKDGIWTYKHDVGAWFVASGCYREVARIVVDHDKHERNPEAGHDVRACYWLLQKGEFYRCE